MNRILPTPLIRRYADKPNEIFSLTPFIDERYLCQAKMDGWRAIIEIDDEIAVWSRVYKSLPISDEMVQAIASLDLKKPAVLDAEWMKRRPDYSGPEMLYLFGVLYWDGQWMGSQTEQERWSIIKSLSLPNQIRLPLHTTSGYGEFFEMTKEDPTSEGVVLKDLSGTLVGHLSTSKKNPSWFKYKWRSGFDGKTIIN